MLKTGNFQATVLDETRCPACGALANPRWARCLSCKSALSAAPSLTQPGISSEAITATPLAQTAAKSKLPPETLDAEDWRSFFNERAAILEHDGGATHENANRLAYEACIAALSWVLPANYPHDRCAACGSHLGPQQGLPLADTAVVCNNACQTQHMQQQRERAESALGEMDVFLNCC